MKYVLLFFVWLTLCYSSLSANEVTLHTQKDLQTSISTGINIGKKKKSPFYSKIKLHSTKARLFFSKNSLPDLLSSTRLKPTQPTVAQTIGWSTSKKFSYQYIFSYLYPKHAFW